MSSGTSISSIDEHVEIAKVFVNNDAAEVCLDMAIKNYAAQIRRHRRRGLRCFLERWIGEEPTELTSARYQLSAIVVQLIDGDQLKNTEEIAGLIETVEKICT